MREMGSMRDGRDGRNGKYGLSAELGGVALS